MNRRGGLRGLMVVAAVVAMTDGIGAYVGPGAGLTAIGTVLGVIGAVVLAIVGFVWYPLKRLLRRIRRPVGRGGEM